MSPYFATLLPEKRIIKMHKMNFAQTKLMLLCPNYSIDTKTKCQYPLKKSVFNLPPFTTRKPFVTIVAVYVFFPRSE